MVYKNILAAVNEFSNSEIAARYAITLAKSSEAKLFLVFIADEKIEKERLRHAETALERLFIEAEETGVEVESIIKSGEPAEQILEIVNEHDIDIVFTATRRQDAKARFFVKTLSRQLMIKLPCAVAMVRVVKMGGTHLKNILVPLRGRTPGLKEKAYFAAKLAEGMGSGVTLLHTRKPATKFFHGEVRLKPVQRDVQIPEDIKEFSEYLHKHNIPVEKKIEYGGVARSITVEAAFRKNDLIVMGASEKSLLSSIARDNPVEHVLRETPCNLIIFRGRKS
ncbi:MAG: universal stress protein [Nitrospirae bacterium]|nr:universal stress protein [Nitrospirota bacterium]